MVNLYFNFYTGENKDRNFEIDFCFNKNFNSKVFDKIYLIISESDLCNFNLKSEIIEKIIFNKRPTFKDYIDIINNTCGDEDINVFMNSDCYICKETSHNILKIKKEEMWCLQKYNIIDNNLNFEFENIDCSQDVWVFKGKPKKIENIDFYFGIPGCDNRFSYECEKCGYYVLNPSLDLKFFHYHLSSFRTCPYDKWEQNRIQRPYKMIQPSKLLI